MPDPIPFSEPPWLSGHPSPYYNESHRQWQRHCREFITENLTKHAMQWENDGAVPPDTYRKFAKANMLIPNLPAPLPVEYLKKVGIHKIGPLKVEDFGRPTLCQNPCLRNKARCDDALRLSLTCDTRFQTTFMRVSMSRRSSAVV